MQWDESVLKKKKNSCPTNINSIKLGKENDRYFGFTYMLVESLEKEKEIIAYSLAQLSQIFVYSRQKNMFILKSNNFL